MLESIDLWPDILWSALWWCGNICIISKWKRPLWRLYKLLIARGWRQKGFQFSAAVSDIALKIYSWMHRMHKTTQYRPHIRQTNWQLWHTYHVTHITKELQGAYTKRLSIHCHRRWHCNADLHDEWRTTQYTLHAAHKTNKLTTIAHLSHTLSKNYSLQGA